MSEYEQQASKSRARIAKLEAELDLANAERSSASEAATVLLKALGWSSGGLGAAAIEIVAERDRARVDLTECRDLYRATLDAYQSAAAERNYLRSAISELRQYSREQYATLTAERDRARDHLRWTLPMANGYAHEHPVGDNAGKVADADAFLASEGKVMEHICTDPGCPIRGVTSAVCTKCGYGMGHTVNTWSNQPTELARARELLRDALDSLEWADTQLGIRGSAVRGPRISAIRAFLAEKT